MLPGLVWMLASGIFTAPPPGIYRLDTKELVQIGDAGAGHYWIAAYGALVIGVARGGKLVGPMAVTPDFTITAIDWPTPNRIRLFDKEGLARTGERIIDPALDHLWLALSPGKNALIFREYSEQRMRADDTLQIIQALRDDPQKAAPRARRDVLNVDPKYVESRGGALAMMIEQIVAFFVPTGFTSGTVPPPAPDIPQWKKYQAALDAYQRTHNRTELWPASEDARVRAMLARAYPGDNASMTFDSPMTVLFAKPGSCVRQLLAYTDDAAKLRQPNRFTFHLAGPSHDADCKAAWVADERLKGGWGLEVVLDPRGQPVGLVMIGYMWSKLFLREDLTEIPASLLGSADAAAASQAE